MNHIHIKKFQDYIKEDYNPSYQLSLFDEKNTLLDSAQQLVVHYTSPESPGYSEIRTGRQALDFLTFKLHEELPELMRSFIRYNCRRDAIAKDLITIIANYFPEIDSDILQQHEQLLLSKKPNAILYLNSIGLDPIELVKKNYEKQLAQINYNYHAILGSYVARNATMPTIKVYRAVMLNSHPASLADDTSKHSQGVGKYWAYQPSGAVAYDARGHNADSHRVCLEAEAKWSDVNWGATLIKSLYSNSSEQEIELFIDATPKVTSILVDVREMAKASQSFNKLFKFQEVTPEIKSKYDVVEGGGQIRLMLPHPDFVSVGENPNRTYDKNYYD